MPKQHIQLVRPNNPSNLTEREYFSRQFRPPEHIPHVYLHTCDRCELYRGDGTASPEIARHLFSVAAGLDSPLIGENAILGQVKRAYLHAQTRGNVSSGLHRLFQHALRTGKRVRSQTTINTGSVTHSHGVLSLLQVHRAKSVLLIAASECTKSLLPLLRKDYQGTIYIANRSLDKAESLAAVFKAQAIPLSKIKHVAGFCNTIISSTGSPNTIVTPEILPDDGHQRLLFDLAVPRDIAPELATRPGIRLFNLEDIEQILQNTMLHRHAELPAAWKIVSEEVRRYIDDSNRMSEQRAFAQANRRTLIAAS